MVSVSLPVAHHIHSASLCYIVNVTVHVRPINTDSGMSVRFLNTHVSLVDTFQKVQSHRQRNYYVVV